MVIFPVELAQLGVEVAADRPHCDLTAPRHVRVKDPSPVFRYEDQMHLERGNHIPAAAGCATISWVSKIV